MPPVAYYSIVRYVPDPIRGEQVNVGVLVASEQGEYVGSRFAKDLSRARCVGRREDLAFLRDFARGFEAPPSSPGQLLLPMKGALRWDLDALRTMYANWANSIQLTEPRPALETEPLRLVDEVYERFVEPAPLAPAARARDRRWVLRLGTRKLREELKDRIRDQPANEVLRRRDQVDGAIEPHTFDLVLRLGRAVHAVNALSFEVDDREQLSRDIEATAWAIDDVHNADRDLPITVLAVEREQSAEFQRAVRVYSALSAAVVRSTQVPDWATSAVRSLAGSAAITR